MFENASRTEVSLLGEFGLIDHLAKNFTNNQLSTIKGIGDDAAVIEKDAENVTLISTDLLVEGVHFDLHYMPLKHLGYKAVTVNLSDIYAMNGLPQQITVSLAFSNRFLYTIVLTPLVSASSITLFKLRWYIFNCK